MAAQQDPTIPPAQIRTVDDLLTWHQAQRVKAGALLLNVTALWLTVAPIAAGIVWLVAR